MSDHLHVHHAQGSRQLLIACIVYGVVFLAEAIASYVSGSVALQADAGHMLVDLFALCVAAFAARMGNGAARLNGNSRAELIGALVNATLLIGVMLYILMEAGGRLLHPRSMHPLPAIPVACIGLIANIGIFMLLHGMSLRDFASLFRVIIRLLRNARSMQDINLLMAKMHVLTDGLVSLIAIASNVTVFLTGWWWADVFLSLIIVGLVGGIAVATLRKAMRALLVFDVNHLVP